MQFWLSTVAGLFLTFAALGETFVAVLVPRKSTAP